ncbi:alpha/beta hydrolase fold domain-containing protein [Streptomyces sp. SID8361]|uniref:alpha/beta hydrolase n=1 Tax=Streptomyces sp. MnatMP-M27 TaxID=1839768 RepID=UPI00081DE421|nr:alpha/beta hydrolase [Streptomyces sp. MnatMP-M27]MYU16978.1 alpha/beta hydrolase fold domain-containing protein [Streptomyces sp. SID8361]SCG11552.1 Acetyl esterase/lipase [Streptomyces sp. MnatMP-M27]
MGGAAAEETSVFGLAPVTPDRTIAYGEHPDQVVDFYFPPRGTPGEPPGARWAPRPAPLVLLFHGGAWRAPYDRRHVSPFAAFLAGRGLVVASVEYRRGAVGADGEGSLEPSRPARAGRWPETLDDIAAAVDTVPGLARELGLPGGPGGPGAVDPDRVVLTGHSAGGHAALWAAARHRLPSGTPWHLPSPSPLRGVVALAPIADFATARALDVCSGAVGELLGDGAELTARLALADPAALLPTAIPTTIVQGGTDIDVPPAVADAFAAAAAQAGQDVRLVRTEGGHFPPIDPTTPVAHTVADEIARLAGAPPAA